MKPTGYPCQALTVSHNGKEVVQGNITHCLKMACVACSHKSSGVLSNLHVIITLCHRDKPEMETCGGDDQFFHDGHNPGHGSPFWAAIPDRIPKQYILIMSITAGSSTGLHLQLAI